MWRRNLNPIPEPERLIVQNNSLMKKPAQKMKDKSISKYIAALLLFGSNGIVASYISLTSYEIVFTRTMIGSLFLVLIYVFPRYPLFFRVVKTHEADN